MYFCSGQPTHFCSGVDMTMKARGGRDHATRNFVISTRKLKALVFTAILAGTSLVDKIVKTDNHATRNFCDLNSQIKGPRAWQRKAFVSFPVLWRICHRTVSRHNLARCFPSSNELTGNWSCFSLAEHLSMIA
jgi:hypothetical protein